MGCVEVEKPLPGLQEKSAPHDDAAQGAAPVPPQADVPQGGVSRHRSRPVGTIKHCNFVVDLSICVYVQEWWFGV